VGLDGKESLRRFIMGIKSKFMMQILIVTLAITVGAMVSFGGYSIVDKDAPKDTKKVVIVSSGEKKVEFRDRGDRKVFEVEWDPSGKKMIVKGNHVYLQIHSTGKVEKLTTIRDNQNENTQPTISIQPIVPIYPGQAPSPTSPSAPSTTK
jgi:hypothetical protein